MTPQEFHQTVDPIIVRYEGSVTSGRRSIAHNARVGGSNNSRHLFDLAKDVVLDNPEETIMITRSGKSIVYSMKDAFIEECKRQGLVAVDEGTHIHVQTP
jgi:hypothetical protein